MKRISCLPQSLLLRIITRYFHFFLILILICKDRPGLGRDEKEADDTAALAKEADDRRAACAEKEVDDAAVAKEADDRRADHATKRR